MGLLDTPSGRGALAGSLRGQLLTWGFASSGLTGGLLSTGHDYSPGRQKFALVRPQQGSFIYM